MARKDDLSNKVVDFAFPKDFIIIIHDSFGCPVSDEVGFLSGLYTGAFKHQVS